MSPCTRPPSRSFPSVAAPAIAETAALDMILTAMFDWATTSERALPDGLTARFAGSATAVRIVLSSDLLSVRKRC